MRNKNGLFTIGEFSSITGIGIHSLRYYDEIGALKPAYVDPVSNYRYYSFQELNKIPAITICKNAGISLSDFSDFIDADNNSINYTKLIIDSHDALDKKISECVSRQKDLDKLRQFIDFKAEIEQGHDVTVFLDELYLWLSPFSKCTLSDSDASILRSLNASARKARFRTLPDMLGLIRLNDNNVISDYVFTRIESAGDPLPHDRRIRTLPSGRYLFCKTDECSISSAVSAFKSKNIDCSSFNVISFSLAGNTINEPLHCAGIRIGD